jgi:hypothetical protein
MNTTAINNPITNNIASLRTGVTSTTTSGTQIAFPTLPEALPTPTARTLDEFVPPLTHDPGELLKHRFLCKGGGMLLVGQTGTGKSSLAMQLMIKWALGQPVFGLEPARPIKSLLIQAENDDGDLAEMKSGVFNGLNLSHEEQENACQNVYVAQEGSRTGSELCHAVIEPLLHEIKPDLLWIDPALAYIGSDMNNQKDVGTFLRHDIAPLLTKYGCGVVIVHHTNKISHDPDKQMTDASYLGAGSAEWINWSRAMLALRKTDVENLYELVAAKRGARLKWRAADGESLTFKKYIGHSKRADTICWIEMAVGEAEQLRANNGKTADAVLKHVPQNEMIAKEDLLKTCQQNGIGKNLAPKLIAELVEDAKLFECEVARTGTRPKILFSRRLVTLPTHLSLDQLVQNSSGHFIVPVQSPLLKKEL